MYTVSEEDMLASMIAYLEEENKTELSSILQVSKFVYSPQWEFSGIVSYQRKLYASLRVPIRCRKIIEDNLLSATVMLGASAEILLLDLCKAYKCYLDRQGDATAADAFERKVVNARCAHDRLIEFLKRANSNASLFQRLGFEDINLNFSFFDIIRQTRNDSGHPTGNTITSEQFKMILSNYQHFLPKVLDAINTLKTL